MEQVILLGWDGRCSWKQSSLPGLVQLLARDKREPFFLPGIQIFGASKMQYHPVSVLLMATRNPAETHQLRLVVEHPIIYRPSCTIPGGDLIFSLTFTLHINGAEEHATRNQPEANLKMNCTMQVLQLPSSRPAL